METGTPDEVETRGRLGPFVVTVMTVAAFGPYVAPGIRTEQLAVYGFAFVALVLLMPRRWTNGAAFVALAWGLYLVIAGLGLLAPPNDRVGLPPGDATAGMDNVTLPLAVMIVVVSLVTLGAEPQRLLRRVAQLVIVAMSLNVMAAVLQSRGAADWSAWWGTSDFSVALNAEGNGRFGGIINQPAEAGLLYGIALLCEIYLLARRPGWLLIVMSLTIVGGVMTVSKVFLLIALPIGLWQLLRLRDNRGIRLWLTAAAAGGFYLALAWGWFDDFKGAAQLRALLPGVGESRLTSITASRFGEQSTIAPVIDIMLDASPVFGLGPAGLARAYDNGWIEALVIAGLVGVLAYTLALAAMLRVWQRAARSAERTFLGGLALLALGASFGVPALTANRAATVFWLLAGLLLAEIGTLAIRSPATEDLEHAGSTPSR